MAEFKFTRDDRAFLKQMHISAEPSLIDDMVDILTRPPQYNPNCVIISAQLARDIIAEYGELNIDTFIAFRSGRTNGKKNESK